jgi:hypothetical protein
LNILPLFAKRGIQTPTGHECQFSGSCGSRSICIGLAQGHCVKPTVPLPSAVFIQ